MVSNVSAVTFFVSMARLMQRRANDSSFSLMASQANFKKVAGSSDCRLRISMYLFVRSMVSSMSFLAFLAFFAFWAAFFCVLLVGGLTVGTLKVSEVRCVDFLALLISLIVGPIKR